MAHTKLPLELEVQEESETQVLELQEVLRRSELRFQPAVEVLETTLLVQLRLVQEEYVVVEEEVPLVQLQEFL